MDILERRVLHLKPGLMGEHETLTLTTSTEPGSGPGMTIGWRRLGGFTLGATEVPAFLSARMELHSDNWHAFTLLPDVFALLATLGTRERGKPTAQVVMRALLNAGWSDAGDDYGGPGVAPKGAE